MKNKTFLAILFVCSMLLLSGCSYSDFSGDNNGGSGNDGGNADIIDDTPIEKTVYWEPKKTFTVPNIAEINITSVSSTEEVKPPKTNGVYSYQADQAGETYILAKGTFKNLLADDFDDWDNFDGKLIYDNNYEYDVYVKFATDSDNDFYTTPKPLQTLNVYFIVSVPTELIKTNKNFSLQLQFTDDSEVSSDVYEYNFIFNNN